MAYRLLSNWTGRLKRGRFHEAEAFEDYFRFDYLESELDSVHELLAQL